MRAVVFVSLMLIAGAPAGVRADTPIANAADGVADTVRGLVHRIEPSAQSTAGAVADTVRELCRRVEASETWPAVGNALDDVYRRGREMLESPGPRHPPRWSGIVRPREEGIDRQMAIVPPERHGTLKIVPPPGTPGGEARIDPR